MITIPEEVKSLLKNDNTKKNFRVHFPDGERSDLTNSDVIEESVSLTESICSEEKLKFGLCESPYIEFETINVQNIKGCTIECALEIYCSSTTEDAEYKEDLEAYIYSIPLGTFIVDSCKKQADMTHRKIQAYSSTCPSNVNMMSRYLGENMYSFPISVEEFVVIALNSYSFVDDYTEQELHFSTSLDSVSRSIVKHLNENVYVNAVNDSYSLEYVKMRYSSQGTTHTDNITQDNIFYMLGDKDTISNIEQPSSWTSATYKFKSSYKDDSEIAEAFTDLIKERFVKNGMMKVISELDYWLQRPSTYSVNEISINPSQYLGSALDGMYYGILTNVYFKTAIKRVGIPFLYCDDEFIFSKPKFVIYSNNKSQSYEADDFESAYAKATQYGCTNAIAELNSIALGTDSDKTTIFSSSIPHSTSDLANVTHINFAPSNLYINISEAESNAQDVVEGWAEFQGKFGSVERDGTFSLFSAKDNFQIHNGTLTADDYSSLWYGDDESLPIGRLICTWKDSNGKEHFSERKIVDDYDASMYRTYSITNNWFIQNYPYTSAQISSIFDEMSENITSGIRYMPMELTIKGRPDIEVGDVFNVETSEGIITGFIEKRTLSGIDNLVDTITSQDEERATSNSSLKSSFDEETGTLTIYT